MTRHSRPFATAAIPPRSTTFRQVAGALEKRCSRCHEWWPADTDFFTRHEVRPGGLTNQCRACSLKPRPAEPAKPVALACVPWLGTQQHALGKSAMDAQAAA